MALNNSGAKASAWALHCECCCSGLPSVLHNLPCTCPSGARVSSATLPTLHSPSAPLPCQQRLPKCHFWDTHPRNSQFKPMSSESFTENNSAKLCEAIISWLLCWPGHSFRWDLGKVYHSLWPGLPPASDQGLARTWEMYAKIGSLYEISRCLLHQHSAQYRVVVISAEKPAESQKVGFSLLRSYYDSRQSKHMANMYLN